MFGRRICNIRNELKLTQKNISDKTYINVDTLRKIENGKVTPRQDTLEILSPILKKDLNKILLEYRLPNYTEFSEIQDKIECDIENGNYNSLEKNLYNINRIVEKINLDLYISKNLEQLALLIKAIILNVRQEEYQKSLEKLIDAIKITTPTFRMSDYNTFVYSRMEIRILMNMALNINRINSNEKGLKILKFCLSIIEPYDYEFKIKILYNISYNYHRLDLNEKALTHAIKGINTCIENNSLSCLGLLYSRKGIAEYFLGFDNHINTLQKAITIYGITNQNKLKDMFIKVCTDYKIQLTKN